MNLLLQGIFCFVFGKRVKRRSPLTFEAKETYPIACIDLSLLIFFCKSFLRLLHIWPHYPSRSCFPDFVTCYWQHSSSTRAWVIRWLRFFSFRWIRIFPSQILYISYFPYHLPLSDVRYAENYSTYFCLVFFSSVKSTVDWFVFMFFSFHSSTLVGKRSLCYLSFDSFPFSKVTHGIRKRKKL